MADPKKLTIEEKQALLLDAQLECELLTLDRTKKESAVYTDTEEDRQRKREQAQMQAKAVIDQQAAREKKCKHQAGVQPGNVMGRGVGGSCLSASRIGFSWMWLIQCVWCHMKNLTPHPSRKSTKPQRVKVDGAWRLETAAEVNRLERDGATMIGMTGMPEASLARELELKYAALAVSANHAAGRGDSGQSVSMEQIARTLEESMGRVRRIIERMVVIHGRA